MAVKKMKWSSWPSLAAMATKRYQVTVKPMKLYGFCLDCNSENDAEKIMAVQMTWKGGSKLGLVPFRTSRYRKDVSKETVVKKGDSVEWDDEFENSCSFTLASNGGEKFVPWDVSFKFLYGETKGKMEVIGKVTLNIGEMASDMESSVERELPINLQVAGVSREATFMVQVNFVEIRVSQDPTEPVQNSTELKGSTRNGQKNEKKKQLSQEDLSFRLESEGNSETSSELGTSSSSETQLDQVKKIRLLPWKRRRLSLIKSGQKIDVVKSSEFECQCKDTGTGDWEAKELISRDGHTKLRASVFMASFDQRSDKAAGESACTALVAVIAHWLHSNRDAMPTMKEFNSLIIEGSSEWRKLCDNEAHVNDFPNKHFDLETVLHAGIRPLNVSHEKSFVGFFSPQKFQSLKEAMSFDEIWNEITRKSEDSQPGIYIVSWNDHFFVLKAEANAYYIIDTLGERLFEGCSQAYILRFDDSAVMHGKQEKEGVQSSAETTTPEEGSEEVICSGKECCREFIKRFLASIQLRELELEEEKEPVSYFSLHQRLQIEFNFSSSASSSLSSLSLPVSSSANGSTTSVFE